MTHTIRFSLATLIALFLSLPTFSQKKESPIGGVLEYYKNYTNQAYSNAQPVRVEDTRIDVDAHQLHLFLNEAFLTQPFTPSLVKKIYDDTKSLLPTPYNTYMLVIYASGTPIELLIPADLLDRTDSLRTYGSREFRGNPWVTPLNLPYSIKNGLQGRHISLWQSHGRYYNNNKRLWEWQRPQLFCTTEDLLTQTIIVPYLIPMLERAGAVVFTPRERDWQKREVIVDNDVVDGQGLYEENNGRYEWQNGGEGFARKQTVYMSGDNPFTHGTFRRIEAQNTKRMSSTIRWQPTIEEEGDYAVYVSYKSLLNSVQDATYTVRHQGISTEFRVNQQMGGGTWVYLGTFHFDKGTSYDNCVQLSNFSNYRGVITADAVRFGGGMGNVARNDSTMNYALLSGLPRSLEAARYSAQWYGFHDTIYHARDVDYNDDIIVRPSVENILARGSMYNPGDSGYNVPIELSMGIHSDAGYREDNTLIGSLGIYTTDWNDGVTAAGLSRLTSRDLIDNVITQISTDMTNLFGGWNRRQIYDRNYGETREPLMPGVILEMFSHQNWADMRLAHDPFFKFMFARAIYKGILRYLSFVHGKEAPVTQPLPVTDLSAVVDRYGERVTLRWSDTYDLYDPTAKATAYVIYTAEGNKGFDNGTLVQTENNTYELTIQPNTFYRFRIAAVNAGGASAVSEEVCAYKSTLPAHEILIVDGFQRVAGPYAFDTDSTGGFDMDIDGGVADIRTAGYCGKQVNMLKSNYGKIDAASFGYSTTELQGMILAGNTHDYCTRHGIDILATGLPFNVSSCVGGALETTDLSRFRVVDIAMGAQKADGYSLRYYKTFSPEMCKAITDYTGKGGSVLLSGAYIGSDMLKPEELTFTHDVLKFNLTTNISTDSLTQVRGMGTSSPIYTKPNEVNYWIRQADVLTPVGGAFCAMLYDPLNQSAAIAYKGTDYSTMTYGFPLECITNTEVRRSIFAASLSFLLQR